MQLSKQYRRLLRKAHTDDVFPSDQPVTDTDGPSQTVPIKPEPFSLGQLWASVTIKSNET